MRWQDVESLARQPESERLEFKRTTAELKGACQTLCGFLNANGGTVLVGVHSGRAAGQDVGDTTRQELAGALRRFEPPAPVDVDWIPVPDSTRLVLALTAHPSRDSIPFSYESRPYQRIDNTTGPMPQHRYQQLLLERLHATRRWENAPAQCQVSELDAHEIRRTLRSGMEMNRLTRAAEASSQDIQDILTRLGLMQEGRPVQAAVVLFGTRFLPDYPQCQLRLARFRGTTKSSFLDQRQLEGHAFGLLNEAMLFLSRHLPVAGRFEAGTLERIDEPLFPPLALREALVNAFCHRDYSVAGGAVSVAIYDDRLEIWSAGCLPAGIRLQDLKSDHESRPRNPLIAGVFYQCGLVERWGRGTQTIVELCVGAGHPEPEFVEQAASVGVRFFPSGYLPPTEVKRELTRRQRQILQLLSQASEMPVRDMLEHLEGPPAATTLRDDLAHLRDLGLVEAQGRGRGAVWRLLRRNRTE